MKKNHTPVGRVLLAAAKVKKPASVGEKVIKPTADLVDSIIETSKRITTGNVAHNIAGIQGSLMSLANILRDHDARRINAAVRKAAWDAAAYAATYLANHAVKDAKGIEVYEADFTAKYGPCPRPRSKR